MPFLVETLLGTISVIFVLFSMINFIEVLSLVTPPFSLKKVFLGGELWVRLLLVGLFFVFEYVVFMNYRPVVSISLFLAAILFCVIFSFVSLIQLSGHDGSWRKNRLMFGYFGYMVVMFSMMLMALMATYLSEYSVDWFFDNFTYLVVAMITFLLMVPNSVDRSFNNWVVGIRQIVFFALLVLNVATLV